MTSSIVNASSYSIMSDTSVFTSFTSIMVTSSYTSMITSIYTSINITRVNSTNSCISTIHTIRVNSIRGITIKISNSNTFGV